MTAARLGGIASVQLTHRLIVFRRANPGGGLTRNRLDEPVTLRLWKGDLLAR
jgi:hypothetical protein